MSRKIYYYTRTGNCEKVAHSYGKDGAGHKIKIVDEPEKRYWGIWGYIKGGANAMMGKEVPFRLIGEEGGETTEVILVLPVWANKIPPTFLAFLQSHTFEPSVPVQVVTVSGSGNGRKVFRQVVDLLHQAGVQEIRHRSLKEAEVK